LSGRKIKQLVKINYTFSTYIVLFHTLSEWKISDTLTFNPLEFKNLKRHINFLTTKDVTSFRTMQNSTAEFRFRFQIYIDLMSQ